MQIEKNKSGLFLMELIVVTLFLAITSTICIRIFLSARLLSNYNLTYSIIGTHKTAEIYNLNVLKEHIEDDKNNKRRFIVIGDGETQPTGKDKTKYNEQTAAKQPLMRTLSDIAAKRQMQTTVLQTQALGKNVGR